MPFKKLYRLHDLGERTPIWEKKQSHLVRTSGLQCTFPPMRLSIPQEENSQLLMTFQEASRGKPGVYLDELS